MGVSGSRADRARSSAALAHKCIRLQIGILLQGVAVSLEVLEESPNRIAEYATVSIAFTVDSILDREALEAIRRGILFTPTPVDHPYVKDCDEYPGNRPEDWSKRFDLSRWGFLTAWADGKCVGGAVVVLEDDRADLLNGFPGAALLWDLRVAPGLRGRRIGSALVSGAERWAGDRGANQMVVETQNVNVVACRFYQSRGYSLTRINPQAYAGFPEEIQLLWGKELKQASVG